MTDEAPVSDAADDSAAMLAEMKQRAAEEAKIAAEQDAALQAVKEQCDAFRAALQSTEE